MAVSLGFREHGAMVRPVAVLGVVLAFFTFLCLGQERVVVSLAEGQSIRELAREYLGDPDLWDEILAESNLDSIAEVKPGTRLTIPVGPVRRAEEKLRESLSVITEASSTGAKIFAPELIAEAIALREEALEERKKRRWKEVEIRAEESRKSAARALERSLELRQVSAEAVLSDGTGTVQGRRPSDLVWVETPVGSVLIEEQRVRTLSDSLAEILFVDESRLRLNENSNAVIQRMQRDALTKREETSVTILAGDVYGILGGTGARKSFTVESSGVKAEVDSLNFWAETDGDTTRLANYDTGRIRVVSGGGATVLGKGQGTLVRAQRAPLQARELLPRVTQAAPGDEAVIYEEKARLAWEALVEATSYWVEVARDPSFKSLVLSRRGIRSLEFTTGELDSDFYYWRVAAVDSAGFPGMSSLVRRFEIRSVAGAPFLALAAPEPGAIRREGRVEVAGTADYDAVVEVDGRRVAVDSSGAFRTQIDLQVGRNEISVRVIDPMGKVTERTRRVVFLPDRPLPLAFDSALRQVAPSTFLTSHDHLTLSGKTEPGVRLEIAPGGGYGKLTAWADEKGDFQLTVPAFQESNPYQLGLRSASGYESEERILVVRDSKNPVIELHEVPPRVTSEAVLELAGSVENGFDFQINGRDVPLEGDHFRQSVELRRGANSLVLMARSRSGVTAELSFEVVRDDQPPEPLRNTLTVEKTPGGRSVNVQVWIREAAAAKRVGKFRVRVGRETLSGYLTLDEEQLSYRGSIDLIGGAEGAVQLAAVELEDYSGNRRLYTFR